MYIIMITCVSYDYVGFVTSIRLFEIVVLFVTCWIDVDVFELFCNLYCKLNLTCLVTKWMMIKCYDIIMVT